MIQIDQSNYEKDLTNDRGIVKRQTMQEISVEEGISRKFIHVIENVAYVLHAMYTNIFNTR